MKVVFVLEQPEILLKLINPNEVNPGVGGTSYTALRLALELDKSTKYLNDNLEIYLGTNKFICNEYKSIPVVDIQNCDLLFDIAIVTGGTLNKLITKDIKLYYKKLISWIRHPFDIDKFKKSRFLNADVVSVGKSQYLSNIMIGGISKHHHIDNLFDSKRIRKASNFDFEKSIAKLKNNNKTFKIGYMGALIESKGFHIIAKKWKGIKKEILKMGFNVSLEVIGGAKLYGFVENHAFLPCEKKYGEKLVSYLDDEINSSVKFHGTLGSERYELMKNCDLAIINPEGDGEAFPATILEWLSLGVPTLSSLNYGCGDVMNLLPLMTIKSQSEIKKKILSYLKISTDDQIFLRKQSLIISDLYTSKQDWIVQQWRFLLLKENSNLLVNEYLNKKVYLAIIFKYFGFLCLNSKIFLLKKLKWLKPIKKIFIKKRS